MTAEQEQMSPLMNTYPPQPVTFVRGEGTYLYDDSGRRYLDFLSGLVTVDGTMIALIDLPHLLSMPASNRDDAAERQTTASAQRK